MSLPHFHIVHLHVQAVKATEKHEKVKASCGLRSGIV